MSRWHTARKKPGTVEFREVQGEKEEIHTLEGVLVAEKEKHLIIRGVHGEEYPIARDIFDETYSTSDYETWVITGIIIIGSLVFFITNSVLLTIMGSLVGASLYPIWQVWENKRNE